MSFANLLGSAKRPQRLDRQMRTCAPWRLASSDVPWGVARPVVSASTGLMTNEAVVRFIPEGGR
jgi:hypothetical protein